MSLKTKVVVSALGASLLVLAGASFTACTSILGDFDVSSLGSDGGDGGVGIVAADLGKTCASGTQCSTGFCVDGVCCESACSGTCEACNGADKGKCAAVPDGQDPGAECAPIPLPDAGLPDASNLGDGGDAGDAGEGGLDGGTVINIPDGGIVAMDEACKGTCDGARKCKYPGKDTGCGGKFCNTKTDQGREVCDGKGHCNLSIDACVAYACVSDSCKSSCAAPTDCLATHFCNTTGACQEKLGDSIACANPDQCTSGFCANGVCCDSACDSSAILGATCVRPGSVGKCKCTQDCGTGSCILVYLDADGDGYGDKFGSISKSTAKVACDNAIPAGWVIDHTDCADGDPNAHPGQTAWFGTPVQGLSVPSYDYNCDGVIEKLQHEYPGGVCHFCVPPVGSTCDETHTTCSSAGLPAFFACPLSTFCRGFTCSNICGPFAANTYGTAFTSTVPCGATATATTCGSCTTLDGPVTGNTPTTLQQTCH